MRPFFKPVAVATFLVSVAFPSLAKAGEWVVLPASFRVWTSTYNDDVIRITSVNEPLTNPGGCADPDSYMVRTTHTKEMKSRIFAALLLAKAQGKPVRVWVNGCESARPALEVVIVD